MKVYDYDGDDDRRLRSLLGRHDERASAVTRLAVLLADGRWHTTAELAAKVGHRFGSAVHTLRHRHGLDVETVREQDGGRVRYQYRLRPRRTR